MISSRLTFIAIASSLLIHPIVAKSSTELDPVVVTATRTPLSSAKLLSSVSVITRQDIERFNFQTLAQAINSLAGVSISNSGGLGKQTSLFLRGTESNHTQIILNGVKLATNEFGAPQLEHIPLNQIERIELVSGPQSSLYGSESIGGTIQIFTKKGGNKLTPSASLGYGSHDTKQTTIGLAGGGDNNWFNVSLAYTTTGGFDACDDDSARLGIACFADEPDNDGYRNANSSVTAGHRFANEAALEVFSLYSKGKTKYDGYFNETEFRQHTLGSSLTFNISKLWSVNTTLGQGRIESNNYNKTTASSGFADNKQNHFSLQNNIQLNNQHLLTVGYDYENDKISESTGFAETERDNHAIFAQLLAEQGNHNYRLALRNDDNEQFGSHNTGNIAWGVSMSNNLRIHAGFGTAFVAPSLIDLYSPYGSTPALNPERSQSYELGIAGHQAAINWSATIYQTKIKDLIALDSSFIPQNISKARIKGFELQAATKLLGMNIDGQFSWLDPKNTNNGKVLARRAKQTVTLNAHKSFGRFDVTSKIFVAGSRYDDAANTRKLHGYTTVDLIMAYRLNNSTKLRLKIANLFDDQYETVAGYNTDGANMLLSIHYQP